MTDKRKAAAALLMAALLAVCLQAVSEGADAYEADKTYGTVKEFSWTEVENVSKELFGKSVEELIMELSVNDYGYVLHLDEPHFVSEMATEREVGTSEGVYRIQDHVSAYLEFGTTASVHGNLPEAGTYQRQDGENSGAFLDRVLREGASQKPSDVGLELLFCVYVDVDVVSRVDVSTGELTGNDILAKLFIVEYESSDVNLALEDDGEEVDAVTITYGKEESYSNVYVSTDIGMSYKDMVLFNDAESWAVDPEITAHVNHVFVSSDMANGVWNIISQISGLEGVVKSRLPGLILNIVESGNRMVDLVETVKSLTGTDIRDIDFLAEIEASNVKDDAGREYVDLDVIEKDGSLNLRFPKSD
ncbi:MAG: hypothetical protein J5674_02975, partial [Candidatus Methanomethylophilaceae archaeon]|nr:hypothetical protein [Candidatus Methanomethylophilaceae archaeon]